FDGEDRIGLAGRTEGAFAIRASDLELLNPGVDLLRREPFFLLMGRGLEELVAAIRLAAARAGDQDVGEMVNVTACLQRRLREDRRRVDEVVVVAQAEE